MKFYSKTFCVFKYRAYICNRKTKAIDSAFPGGWTPRKDDHGKTCEVHKD